MRRTLAAAATGLLMALTTLVSATFSLTTRVEAQWRDQAVVRDLYEKARAERTVVVWGPQRGEVDWIARAFPEAFPGIEVQFVGDNDIVTRAIAEARGGRHQIDVIWNSVTATLPLVQRKLVAPVDWKTLGVDNPATGFDGAMLYASKVLYSVAFDPSKVDEATLPKSWDGYLDPKYKGQMAASLFLLPRLTGGLALAWGEEKALDWVRELVNKQDVLLTRAPRETFVTSGERKFAFGEIENTYRRHALEGQIFGVSIPEPVVLVQFGTIVMAEAPHASAGRLLAAWLATNEGRAARQRYTGAIDYDAGSMDPFAQKLNAGALSVVPDTPETMEQRDAAIRKATPIVSGSVR